MVHLSPDSRLLVSLVKQEQAYAAQLHNLLNASGTSLSALAVYASSSPPTVSSILNGVASALSGADEALRTYGEALNDWIDQLRTIKLKEEEVANIGRDREILVTRLLKVSQKAKSPPPSLLHVAPDTASSSSFPTFNSKITAAQTELQACESHLAEKELELERVRIHAIGQGLKLRCGALVQCGWAWSDMGRRALSMLEELNGVPPPANGHAPEFFKPLPNPTHDHDRDSVRSSLSPSQSASQIGGSASSPSQEQSYRLSIPPPHLLSEHTAIPGPPSKEPEDGSSSEEEGPVEVYENPRFQPAPILSRQRSVRTAPSTPARGSPIPFLSPSKGHVASSDVGPSMTKSKNGRDRKSTGLFGSIALLFKTSMNGKSTPSQFNGNWSTRTERNLRSVKTDGEESSGDENAQPRTGRLRKGKVRATTMDDSKNGRRSTALVGAGASPLSMPSPSTPSPVKRKKSGGKLARSGTVRSTISEPAPAPRVRANTLTASSSGVVLAQAHGGTPRSYGRTASMDGRWGLAGAGSSSTTSLHSPVSTPTWKPPKLTVAAKGDSLMSIVEGVSRSNQVARSPVYDDPSSKLEVVRAPGSHISGLPLLVHPPPPLPTTASAPNSPIVTSSIALKRSSLPAPSTSGLQILPATEKKPLRSAMRNPNKDRSASPSPSRSPNTNASESEQLSSTMSPLTLPGPASPSLRPMSISRPEIPSTIIESPRHSIVDMNASQTSARIQSPDSMKTDDSASISSYETGHENFDDDETGPETPSAPHPPPVVAPPSPPSPPRHMFEAHLPPNGNAATMTSDKHEVSSATSTDTATGAPTRRKSVRMSSLPPQVSATPPALEDYEDEDRSPWGKSKADAPVHDESWKTRTPTTNIAWDDSSSEDEEYKAARKALNRVERRSSKR